MTLEEVVRELDAAYAEWKGGEKNKNKYKDEFFKLAEEALKDETLAEKVVETVAADEADARAVLDKRYPTWVVTEVREHPDKDGYYEAIIQENPYYLSFTYEYGDKVFQRQIVSGSAMLDDERLQAEDPELYFRVTTMPHQAFLEDLMYNCGVDPERFDGTGEYEEMGPLWTRPWVLEAMNKAGLSRELRDLEDLSAEDLAILQKYMYEGKPTIKFPAPKKVKKDA